MAARKQKATEYPADILAMSKEELRQAERDHMTGDKFDQLIAERDRAQAAVETHRTRHALLLARLVDLMRAEKEAQENPQPVAS